VGNLLAGLALLVLAGALLLLGRLGRQPPVPVLGRLPAFALLESGGGDLTRDALLGRVWVADFIFTRCAGVCPAMTARMARLRREVPPDVGLVSFTVDPVHDTPAVLADYARGFGADASWLFVTGPRDALYGLATEGFKLAAMELPPGQQSDDGPFLHSSKFVLVDARARIRGYYDSADEQAMAALRADLARVAAEELR
jgi:protein SCO1/2